MKEASVEELEELLPTKVATDLHEFYYHIIKINKYR